MRMVLSGFEANLTEAQIRDILGRPRLGITLMAAAIRLQQAGASAILYNDWSLDDLREALHRDHHPIVGVERHPLGYPPASHAIVIIRVTSRYLTALDPLDGPAPKRYSIHAFDLAWQLAGQEALVIEKPPNE